MLADLSMSWPLSREEVSLFYSPQGLVVVAPLPDDRFRIVATDDAAPEFPSKEYVQALLDARGPGVDPARVHDVAWSSRFRIHHRIASTPRKGRILIGRGRDASDVAISTSFGSSKLTRFKVVTEELASQNNAPADRVRSLSFA